MSIGPYGNNRPRPHCPSRHSALNITGAQTAPNPSASGATKRAIASRTPGATSTSTLTSRSKVRISPSQPVLPRRTENVNIQRVLQCQRAVRHVGRNHDNLSSANGDLPRSVRAEPEVQRTLENVGQLLVLVLVLRHIVSLLE